MPRTKKGRISGTVRKEINERRSGDIVGDVLAAYKKAAAAGGAGADLDLGSAKEIAFARITKMTGANHVRAAVASKHGTKELIARIPNIFARRGATPITTRDVVTIWVGPDFDPDTAGGSSAEHYDITSVLTVQQAQALKRAGAIPEWMAADAGAEAAGSAAAPGGFEFDYAAAEESSESGSEDDKAAGGAGFSRKASKMAAVGMEDEIDVDDI